MKPEHAKLIVRMRRELGPNASSDDEVRWLLAERRRMNAEAEQLDIAEGKIQAELQRRLGSVTDRMQRFPQR